MNAIKQLNHTKTLLKKILNEANLFASRRYLASISRERKMKILFSQKDEWEPIIRRGFRYTQHELSFERFSVENIVKYDVLVPLNIPDLEYLNEVRHLIDNNPIPIPTIESLNICNDKYLFNRTLIENNFENLVPKMSNELRCPYILKKKIDGWGINSHIIIDRQQERNLIDSASNKEYFRQELVPGKHEYATHILYSKGKIIHSIKIEYIFETDIFIKGKNKIISVNKTGECHYLSIFSSILKLIGFEGLCCFNFKIIDNQPLIFEVNPRFGGSLCAHFFSFIKYLN